MATNKQLICLSMILFWLPVIIGLIVGDPTYSFGIIWGIRVFSVASGALIGHVLINKLEDWNKKRRIAKHMRDVEEAKERDAEFLRSLEC